MKALVYALFLLISFGTFLAWSEGTSSGAYEAYWLTNKALGEYVKLVLTRRPLPDLLTISPPTHQPVLDCDAVILTTYARDSIWNVDQQPLKALAGIERVEDDSIVINGERFTCTQAKLEDVLRLLRNPMGTIPIHRIYGPLSGQEELVRILASRLERQLNDGKKAEDQPGAAPPATPSRQ
jgi:hypothetical protein